MLLLAIVVLFWGLSWYAIALQVGDVSPLVSIAWRFGMAGVVLGAYLALRGDFKLPVKHTWNRTASLGLCLFCLNFICFYHASAYIASGLVSIVFAMAVFMISFNQWLWKRVVPERRVMVGALSGVMGLVIVFMPSILTSSQKGNSATAMGLALSLLGTWFFSVGNLISASLSRDTHLPSAIAVAMVLGALACVMMALVKGDSFSIPMNARYIASLLYLAIGASVIAFVAYLTLVAKMGAAKAGYATILFPLVALTVSTFFEGYQWSIEAVFGVALALGGAAIVFVRPSA